MSTQFLSFNSVHPAWDRNYLYHVIYQSPMYFINFVLAFFHSLYNYFTGRSPKRNDIAQFILNTCLALFLTNAGSSRYRVGWTNMELQVGDRYYECIEITFSPNDIHSFIVNGKEVAGTEEMLGILIIVISLFVHPKCHYMSEKSVLEIKKKNVKILERSTRSTLEIHFALLNSIVSPLYSNFYLMCTSATGLIENGKKLDNIHLFLKCKNLPESQFLTFLSRGRTALLQLVKQYDLDIDSEALFNNILFHSTDHYLTYKYSEGLLFAANGKSFLSFIRSSMFRFMFIRETINPFESNLLSSINEPFYQDLYLQLSSIDAEISSHITASLMY